MKIALIGATGFIGSGLLREALAPGERTGKFRLGTDRLLIDAAGNSAISVEDYAVALIDELEKPAHPRRPSLSATSVLSGPSQDVSAGRVRSCDCRVRRRIIESRPHPFRLAMLRRPELLLAKS